MHGLTSFCKKLKNNMLLENNLQAMFEWTFLVIISGYFMNLGGVLHNI